MQAIPQPDQTRSGQRAAARAALLAGDIHQAIELLSQAVAAGERDAVADLHDVQSVLAAIAGLGTRSFPHNGLRFKCTRCQGAIFATEDIPSKMCLACRFTDPQREGTRTP